MDADGRLLLIEQERPSGRQWRLPGGGVEPGESMVEAAVREAREETGLAVRIGRLVALDEYWDEDQLIGFRCIFLAELDPPGQAVSLPGRGWRGAVPRPSLGDAGRAGRAAAHRALRSLPRGLAAGPGRTDAAADRALRLTASAASRAGAGARAGRLGRRVDGRPGHGDGAVDDRLVRDGVARRGRELGLVVDRAARLDADHRVDRRHERARRCPCRSSRSRGCGSCPGRRRSARAPRRWPGSAPTRSGSWRTSA